MVEQFPFPRPPQGPSICAPVMLSGTKIDIVKQSEEFTTTLQQDSAKFINVPVKVVIGQEKVMFSKDT